MGCKIELPDGSIKEYDHPVTAADVAADLSPALAKRAIGVEVNGELWDLTRELPEECKINLILEKDPRAPEFFRHTFSHILAQAVMRIYGSDKVKLGIGPVIENGFYYDFDLGDIRLTEEDLPKIEEEMEKIIKEDLKLERFELPKEEAIKLMKDQNQPYKVELIEDLESDVATFYRQGEFVDLCRGPHMPSTGKVKYFKLLSVSGAYWRGDERNKMLQRIYGTAFAKKSELEAYLKMMEEAKKRDHRKIGPQLGLFSFSYEYAPGMPIYHPKGTIVLNELMKFSREVHSKHGYQEVMTPQIMNDVLWHRSGHWDHYRDNMYFTEKDEQQYAIKPMNCPGHILIYKSRAMSYRDLPLKLFEFGKVHRYERSGVLHGLLRVRGFIQDDAHIFCTREQLKEQLKDVIRFVDMIYTPFGFEYRADLCTRPEDFMGDVEIWDLATEALKDAIESIGLEYKVNEGDGAFYGPKIDFHVTDSIGREWQCATIQLDFMMPERFELTYVGPDNKEYRPVMIHRAIYGSLDRFFGILIEHYAGAFPTWLAPVQVVAIPISDKHVDYAREVADALAAEGVRVDVDEKQKSTNYKIREAQLNKIPYMLILGDKEKESETITVRLRTGKNIYGMKLAEFSAKLKEEISNRMSESIFKAD